MYKTPLTSERKVILAMIALFFGWLFAIIPSSQSIDDQFKWSLSLPRLFRANSSASTQSSDVVVLDGKGRRLAFSPFELKATEPSPEGNSESELASASRNLFLIYDKNQYQAQPIQATENLTASVSSQKPVLERISEENASTDPRNSADSETTLQAGENSEPTVESSDWAAAELQTPEFAPPKFADAKPANWSDKICDLDIDWNADFQESERLSVARNDVESSSKNRKKSVRLGDPSNILESEPLMVQETTFNETSEKKTSDEERSSRDDETSEKPIERQASKPISQSNGDADFSGLDQEISTTAENEAADSFRPTEEGLWKTFADDKTTPAFAVSPGDAKKDVPVSGTADSDQINSAREANHIAELREKANDPVVPETVPIVSVSTGRTVVLTAQATPQEIATRYSLSNEAFELFLELNNRSLDANGVFVAQTLLVIPNDESRSRQ